MSSCIYGRIVEVVRLPNSLNGNPAYSIRFNSGLTLSTSPDDMMAYSISKSMEDWHVVATYSGTTLHSIERIAPSRTSRLKVLYHSMRVAFTEPILVVNNDTEYMMDAAELSWHEDTKEVYEVNWSGRPILSDGKAAHRVRAVRQYAPFTSPARSLIAQVNEATAVGLQVP